MEAKASFLPFCGNERAVRYCSVVFQKKRAQVFLFSGPDAVGKRTAAFRIAARFFCENPVKGDAFGCGVCEPCDRVFRGAHPDFFGVSPEDGSISLAAVRGVAARLSLSSYGGKERGVIIDDAHTLTAEAQSALLKFLEEPPERTFLFLITASPYRLFDTVRSRVLEVPFSEVPEEAITSWLSGIIPAKEAAVLSLLAEGRPGQALLFWKDPSLRERQEEGYAKFTRISLLPLADQLAFSEKLSGEGREALHAFLVFQMERIRRELHTAGEGNTGRFVTLRTMLHAADALLGTNANRRMIADSIFFAMRAHQPSQIT